MGQSISRSSPSTFTGPAPAAIRQPSRQPPPYSAGDAIAGASGGARADSRGLEKSLAAPLPPSILEKKLHKATSIEIKRAVYSAGRFPDQWRGSYAALQKIQELPNGFATHGRDHTKLLSSVRKCAAAQMVSGYGDFDSTKSLMRMLKGLPDDTLMQVRLGVACRIEKVVDPKRVPSEQIKFLQAEVLKLRDPAYNPETDATRRAPASVQWSDYTTDEADPSSEEEDSYSDEGTTETTPSRSYV